MKDIKKIQESMLRIEDLLRLGGVNEWAKGIENLRNEMTYDSDLALGKILSLYGGMGSFNDIILYRNGILLVSENSELDALRSKLYELCRAKHVKP